MIETNKTTYAYINLEYMDMMSEGDASMKMVMIEMLMEELPREVNKMSNLMIANNWSELMSVSHKMKSTLAFVGNEKMTEANKQIELMSKQGQETGAIPGLMETLQNLYPKVLNELQQEMDKLG